MNLRHLMKKLRAVWKYFKKAKAARLALAKARGCLYTGLMNSNKRKLSFFNKSFSFMRSLKLALVLISLLAFFIVLASLFPQQQEAAFYQTLWPGPLYFLFSFLGLENFFRSWFFYFLSGAFTINLLFCSLYRLIKNLKKRKADFGPDLVHLGLLILIGGAVLSLGSRAEKAAWYYEGDELEFNQNISLKIEEISMENYTDGRPKAYLTRVEIQYADQKKQAREYLIQVNKPLILDGISVYQASYQTKAILLLQNKNEEKTVVYQGETFQLGLDLYCFMSRLERPGHGKFPARRTYFLEKMKDHQPVEKIKLKEGMFLADQQIISLRAIHLTALQFVYDQGEILVFCGLLVCALALIYTYLYKLLKGRLSC